MRLFRQLLITGLCAVLGLLISLAFLGNMLDESLRGPDGFGALVVFEMLAWLAGAACFFGFLRSGNPRLGLVVVLLGSAATSVAPAMLYTFVQLIARREWRLGLWAVGLCSLGLLASAWWQPSDPNDTTPWWVYALALFVLVGVLTLIGLVIGHRRELNESLRQEANAVRREQELLLDQARHHERARIAREMHDSLAHHLGLISLHSSALDRRDDLPPETVRSTSRTIAELSRTAAVDLREVLGVLGTASSATAPPAGIAAIGTLIDQRRAAGATIAAEIDTDVSGDPRVLESVSRLFYRAAQESLTNAAKHAPGAPVAIRLVADEAAIRFSCRNRVPLTSPSTGLVGSGVGLAGLDERVRQAGGRHRSGVVGTDFVVEVDVPW